MGFAAKVAFSVAAHGLFCITQHDVFCGPQHGLLIPESSVLSPTKHGACDGYQLVVFCRKRGILQLHQHDVSAFNTMVFVSLTNPGFFSSTRTDSSHQQHRCRGKQRHVSCRRHDTSRPPQRHRFSLHKRHSSRIFFRALSSTTPSLPFNSSHHPNTHALDPQR